MRRFSDWLVEKLEDCDVLVIIAIQVVLSIATSLLTSVLTVLVIRQLRRMPQLEAASFPLRSKVEGFHWVLRRLYPPRKNGCVVVC